MYLFETRLDVSPIHGIGVYAATDIPKGSVVWKKNPFVDIDLPADSPVIAALPEFVRVSLEEHSTVSEDGLTWEAALDGDSFTNHSYTPNLVYEKQTNTFIAGEDIKAGDELTKDYTTFSYSEYDKSLRRD